MRLIVGQLQGCHGTQETHNGLVDLWLAQVLLHHFWLKPVITQNADQLLQHPECV